MLAALGLAGGSSFENEQVGSKQAHSNRKIVNDPPTLVAACGAKGIWAWLASADHILDYPLN